MPSFDTVIEPNLVEVRNAVDQTAKEIGTRFDYKGSSAAAELADKTITLHADSDFQIGQVTDIHVAKMQTQLYHLERALQRLSEERLDLLCPTGDLCDEPRLHLDVLRLIRQVPTRLGHFACLGNHELYLGDLPWVRRSYERADVHLLEDESVKVGGLRLAGISFPHSGRMPRLDHAIVPRLLDETLHDQGRDETTVYGECTLDEMCVTVLNVAA